jgi:hypothetical protein
VAVWADVFTGPNIGAIFLIEGFTLGFTISILSILVTSIISGPAQASEQLAPIKTSCGQSYVPPHSMEDLYELREWVTGGAFNVYAQHTSWEWDQQAYLNDNPYRALFNFGLATGGSCLFVDIFQIYLGADHVLRQALRNSQSPEAQETFDQAYMRWAEHYGLEQYITPPGVLL